MMIVRYNHKTASGPVQLLHHPVRALLLVEDIHCILMTLLILLIDNTVSVTRTSPCLVLCRCRTRQ